MPEVVFDPVVVCTSLVVVTAEVEVVNTGGAVDPPGSTVKI